VLGEDKVLAVLNASDRILQVNISTASLEWEDGKLVDDLLGHGRYRVTEGGLTLTLPAWTGRWIGAAD
ncbi:MAG: hypothetical protein JXB38_12465, partial [Anaerolineales bacterium]|nr:hypothetical protein [Anaerolineales bacterium]